MKVEVITCLVRSVRTEVAFFNDEKGAYLIGADGKRFYSDGKGMLRAEDKSGLVWNVALEDRACPRELQVQMVRYYGVSNSGSSSRGPSYGGPVRPNGGAPDKGQLTTSSAAQWLGQIAGQGSKSGGQKQRGPVAGRWLETDGRRIVQVGGQMLEAGPAGLSNELFYSVEDAGELLQMAKKLCDSSLESWPTLGGQVYRRINSERLERLIGQSSNKQRRTTAPGMSYGKPSRTTSRKSRRVGQASIEPYEESERARGSFLAGDNNRTLAISGDLTAAWSLRIQQGINEDAVGAIVKVQGVGETIGSDGDDPKALFGPDIKSQALDKTTYITGRRPGTNATKRGTDSNGGQRDLQVGERLFLDSRMLAEGCFLRAVSLGKAGLGYEARKAARHGELRVRCFFLAELQEWLRKRQGGRHTLPSELAGVEEDWQKIVEPSDSVGLQRALQAARGEAVTVAWPEVSAKSGSAGSSGKQGSGFLGSLLGSKKIEGSETRPIRAAMTLEAWLDTGNSQREKLPARQVLVSSQFDWGRAVISGTGILKGEKGKETEGEGLALTTERAEEIIRLAGAYESSGRADAATAEALWELGSYAACVGLIEEAQDCLGQAGTAYIQLAEEAAASFNAYGYGGPDIAALREYYKNRTAALLCLAHAGAVEELGGWPDNSVLVLGEVGAKLSQLERQWSDAAGSGTVSGVLQAASDLVESAKTSRSEVGYEYPRKRFWWWHYPFRKQQSQLASDRRQRTGSSVSRRAATRPPLIYDPGAKNQRGQPIMAPGGMPAPQFLPTPGERYGI